MSGAARGDEEVGRGRRVLVGPVRYPALCVRGRRLLLDHGFTLVENSSTVPWTQEELHAMLPGADAAVAGLERYDEEALVLADRLRIISRLGVGLDNVDLKVARTRGVEVVNVPGGNAAAVAELAVGFVLAMARRIPAMNTASREGRWDRYVGVELAGKSVALLGFGAVAQLVAKRLSGFDVELRVYDPFVEPGVVERAGGRLVSLEEAVSSVDVVSVHVPHTPSTHHLVDDDLIALMRAGTLLVNTTRGGLVDQDALVRGLRSGQIGGAGLDVFEVEPVDVSNPLFAFDSVITSPHAAADTVEAYDRIGWATAQAIVDVFSGTTPANVAN